MRTARIAWLGAALIVMGLAGCSHSTDSTAPAVDQPPPADSPAGAVRRYEWAIGHQDADVVASLLTGDFAFVGTGTDSAGNGTRTSQGRDWFMAALRALLTPPIKVTLTLDRNLVTFPDPRPGKALGWHKQIRTSIDLVVRDPAAPTIYEITGSALFMLTRGDSASIPADLAARGVKPDSTAWWIDRYEDESLPGAGIPAATNPQIQYSFMYLLELYYSRLIQ